MRGEAGGAADDVAAVVVVGLKPNSLRSYHAKVMPAAVVVFAVEFAAVAAATDEPAVHFYGLWRFFAWLGEFASVLLPRKVWYPPNG